MQRYKLHSMIISLHDYNFFFSVISHVKIVILTHIVEIRRLKVKYIVNLWIKDTSIQGTKCRVPLCPLKRGSTVYIYNYIYIDSAGIEQTR